MIATLAASRALTDLVDAGRVVMASYGIELAKAVGRRARA